MLQVRKTIFTVVIISSFVLIAFLTPGQAQAAPTELFFSEYVESSPKNQALEIYNGTGAPVDLAANNYNVQFYFNGSATPSRTISLSGTVASGDVFVLAKSTADTIILAAADQLNAGTWFDGDDAVALRKDGTNIDVIGQIGFDPGPEWGSGSASTKNNTLRRKVTIQAGDPNGTDPFVPSIEWDGLANGVFDGLGFYPDPIDAAPTVSLTTPADAAVGVALSSDISITFSEPVDVVGEWLTISCAPSGVQHTFTYSPGTTTYTINPDVDFLPGEVCTVTVLANQVHDLDIVDPPDTLAANFIFSFTTEDTGPSVTGTTPANGAAGVAVASNLEITFSEPVTMIDGWFTISCTVSGSHTAVVSGGPTVFTLNPDTDFGYDEVCTVTVIASAVSDTDVVDPLDTMAANYTFVFNVGPYKLTFPIIFR